MRDIKTLGIDIAKNVFQLHGADSQGSCVLTKRLSRSKLMPYVAKLKPCLIGMEACGGSHYWARAFAAMGHTVKLMAPQFVKPYVHGNKNDQHDAAAIAEAVTRPQMRFVPQKNFEQQDIQSIHRVRQQYVKQRTSTSNQIRGLLAEYGIVIPLGINSVKKHLMALLEDAENGLTSTIRDLLYDIYTAFKNTDTQIKHYDKELGRIARANHSCRLLMEIEGVGPTSATAFVAAVGSGHDFKNGREVAAWLGLVPRHRASGENQVMLGLSKQGDRYLRTLLIHGGRAVTKTAHRKQDARSRWINNKVQRSGMCKTACAVANKNARIMWALLSRNEAYRQCA